MFFILQEPDIVICSLLLAFKQRTIAVILFTATAAFKTNTQIILRDNFLCTRGPWKSNQIFVVVLNKSPLIHRELCAIRRKYQIVGEMFLKDGNWKMGACIVFHCCKETKSNRDIWTVTVSNNNRACVWFRRTQ